MMSDKPAAFRGMRHFRNEHWYDGNKNTYTLPSKVATCLKHADTSVSQNLDIWTLNLPKRSGTTLQNSAENCKQCTDLDRLLTTKAFGGPDNKKRANRTSCTKDTICSCDSGSSLCCISRFTS
jgi:hypothetical protein